MQADGKNKKIGKIFMGPASNNEATVESLDAMQAASRKEQLQQRSLASFEATVRTRAIEKARLILGEAYGEREKILAEAREEAKSIINESRAELHRAEDVRAEAQRLSDSAKDIENEAVKKFETAHEQGFDAGIEASKEELQAFRAAMGDSIAAVLSGVNGQCMSIFDGWRQELAETVKACVEKATGYVLNADRRNILNALLVESVTYLDQKRSLTIRVNPQDEEAVSDIISAGRERFAGVENWNVRVDERVEPGGFALESEYGAVDNRMEVRRAAVENIINNLTIPKSQLDEEAMSVVADAFNSSVETIMPLAYPEGIPQAAEAEPVVEDAVVSDMGVDSEGGDADAAPLAPDEEYIPDAESDAAVPMPEDDMLPLPAGRDSVRPDIDAAPQAHAQPPSPVAPRVAMPREFSGVAASAASAVPEAPLGVLDALERELLGDGYDDSTNEALAGGGFLPPKNS